jgi:hypothetical protein
METALRARLRGLQMKSVLRCKLPVDNGNSGDANQRALVPYAGMRLNVPILRRWETTASDRAPDLDRPDEQRPPSRTRPGDRPPVQTF